MESIKHFNDEMFDPNRNAAVKAKEYLNSRGITDETIRSLKIGLDYSGNQIRIRIPYWDKSGKNIVYYVTRSYPNGQKNSDEPKYKKASLEYNPFLRNAPLGLNMMEDGEFCVIAEGAFDWLNLYQRGIPALSPNGCDFGKLWPEVTEVIKQHFRYVILAFDNDGAGIKATAKAAEILMKEEIPFKVARFFYVKDFAEYCEQGEDVPKLLGNAQDGLKWYINYIKPDQDFDNLTIEERQKAQRSCKEFIRSVRGYTSSADVQEALQQLKNYFPKEWFSSLVKETTKGLSEDEACEKVLKTHKIKFNEKIGFYEFTRNGIWERQDDTTILGYIKNAYGPSATGSKISTTLKLLKAHDNVNSKKILEDMNTGSCVSFLNGTLHIDPNTGKTTFLPHNPDDYVSVCLPYFYDKDATAPEWEKFIDDVTDGNKAHQLVLQEFSGYPLLPDCRFQKALMLKGGGSNGKGVFTETIAQIYGDRGKNEGQGYVSYSEPAKFGKDFRLMAFRYSWLNISTEVENDMNGGEGVFKKVVAGEILEDSYKHKDPFCFRTRAKLIWCANMFPTIRDTTIGFLRRWIIVPFTQLYLSEAQVREGKKGKVLDPCLKTKLLKERAGIFNWCLKGLLRLLSQNGFTEFDGDRELVYEFAKANNALYCFTEENLGAIRGKKIYRTEIYNRYRKWAEVSGVTPLAANRFYSNLKAVWEIYSIKVIEHGRYWTIEGGSDLIPKDEPEEPVVEEKVEVKVIEKRVDPTYQQMYDLTSEFKEFLFRVKLDPNDDGKAIHDSIEEIVLRHINSWK